MAKTETATKPEAPEGTEVPKDALPNESGAQKVAKSAAKESQDVASGIAPRFGVELGSGSVPTESEDTASVVVVSEDVFEKFYFPNTTRPSYRLLYRKGQVVAKADLDAAVQRAKDQEEPTPHK